MNLEFRTFERSTFHEYSSWFENPKIRKALSFVDEEWLEYVMTNDEGVEYAIFENQKLVAVLGFVKPTSDYPMYGLTNLAVNPSYFQQGVGSKVLAQLLILHPPTDTNYWMAYVDIKNDAAQGFFKKNDWQRGGQEEDMIRFEKKI